MLKQISFLCTAYLSLLSIALCSDIDHVSYKFQYFDDNNDVNVITNTTAISKGFLDEHLRVNLSYLVDGITGASRNDDRGFLDTLDGITAASETKERRHEVKGSLTFMFDWLRLFNKEKDTEDPMFITVTGINSQETDYTSRTISGAVSQDLFQRNTTFGLSYTKSFDKYDPAPRFETAVIDQPGYTYFGNGAEDRGRRETDRLTLSVTQGITLTTLASVIGGYTFDRGYLARPYYVYRIETDTDTNFYHEHLPSERRSMTLTGQLRQYIPTEHGTSIHLDYRLYFDSWDLLSHTISLKGYYRFDERFIVSPSYRFYMQNSAFFYKDTYTEEDLPTYLTTDFKYRECMTHTMGLKLIYEVKDFFKPDDAPILTLFPINIDIAANYMIRTGTNDAEIIHSHYNYWSDRYRNFWIQAGVTFAY